MKLVNYVKEANRLKKALFDTGDNCDLIIDILTRFKRNQREVIVTSYQEKFNRNLKNDFKSELGGAFEDACIALIIPLHELSADIIFRTLTSEKFSFLPIIDVFFTNASKDLAKIKDCFSQKYGLRMEKMMKEIRDSNMSDIACKLVANERNESDQVDFYLAYEEASELNEAGLGLSLVKQNKLLNVLCTRNFAQLRLTLAVYQQVTGNSLEDDIQRYFDGDLHDIFTAIITCIKSFDHYFAQRLYDCLILSNNDRTIIDILVARLEIDLDLIQYSFKRSYGTSLENEIRRKIKGNFKSLLQNVLKTSLEGKVECFDQHQNV